MKYTPDKTALVTAAQLYNRGLSLDEVAGGLDMDEVIRIAKELKQEVAKAETVTTPKLDLDRLWGIAK
jgi:hypothetical protein